MCVFVYVCVDVGLCVCGCVDVGVGVWVCVCVCMWVSMCLGDGGCSRTEKVINVKQFVKDRSVIANEVADYLDIS